MPENRFILCGGPCADGRRGRGRRAEADFDLSRIALSRIAARADGCGEGGVRLIRRCRMPSGRNVRPFSRSGRRRGRKKIPRDVPGNSIPHVFFSKTKNGAPAFSVLGIDHFFYRRSEKGLDILPLWCIISGNSFSWTFVSYRRSRKVSS